MIIDYGAYGDCRALCPFGLTCQRFGMVWDGENEVGLNKLLFLYNMFALSNSVIIFSLGTLGVSLFGPILGVLHRTAGHNIWFQSQCTGPLEETLVATRRGKRCGSLRACEERAHRATFVKICSRWWSICSALWHATCSNEDQGAVQACVVRWVKDWSELERLQREDLQ